MKLGETMAGKTLTISIAAYNVETYIRKTIESILKDKDIIDDLEIFVIDDGGTDQTMEIVQEYVERYPKSVIPVYKENGGYGSTVNYSLTHATGKYFKLLDGDDWFDSEHLSEFVRLLKGVDSDIVVTPYFFCEENGKEEKSNTVCDYPLNAELTIKTLKYKQAFGMWSLTFKTSLLKECGFELPQNCLYTDQIYSTMPFSMAKTIIFVDCTIYCYRLDRDGQSISKESRIKHVDDCIKTAEILCEFYKQQKLKGCENLRYILFRTSAYARNVIRTYLLEPISAETLKCIEKYEKTIKNLFPDVYSMESNIRAFKKTAVYLKVLRLTRYGEIGLLMSKIILPKQGIENWQ